MSNNFVFLRRACSSFCSRSADISVSILQIPLRSPSRIMSAAVDAYPNAIVVPDSDDDMPRWEEHVVHEWNPERALAMNQGDLDGVLLFNM